MSPLEQQESNYRLVVALAGLLSAVLFIGLLHLALPYPPASASGSGKLPLADVLIGRACTPPGAQAPVVSTATTATTAAPSPTTIPAPTAPCREMLPGQGSLYPLSIQNLMWLLFFMGIGELWVRFDRGRRETQQLSRALLPEDDSTMLRSKDLGPVYAAATEAQHSRHYFVQRLIQRIVLQFKSSGSVDQANTLMNSSLELMQHEIELKYSMLRYLVWLIPTIGFIGTVIGIALSLSAAADMPELAESNAIRDWMGVLTTRLGIAFNTTLLALMMSAVLVFFMHIAQGREESALNGAGQYCIDNLINRLYEPKAVQRAKPDK